MLVSFKSDRQIKTAPKSTITLFCKVFQNKIVNDKPDLNNEMTDTTALKNNINILMSRYS